MAKRTFKPKKPAWPEDTAGKLARCAFCGEAIHLRGYRWLHERERVLVRFERPAVFRPLIKHLPLTAAALGDLAEALGGIGRIGPIGPIGRNNFDKVCDKGMATKE